MTAIAALLAALAPLPSQAGITYNVNFNGLTGTIETDGTFGQLAETNYLAFDLTYTETGFSTHAQGTTANVLCFSPCALNATASGLSLVTTESTGMRFADAGNPQFSIAIAFVFAPPLNVFAGLTANNPDGYRTPVFDGANQASFGTAATAPGIPEPGALSLVAAGLAGAAVARRRRKG